MVLERGSSEAIRTYILADVRIFREDLAQVLELQEQIRIVGTAADTMQAIIEMKGGLQPQVIVLHLTRGNHFLAVRELAGVIPEAKIVALAVPDGASEFIAYVEAGISGFVTLEESLDDLVRTIRSVTRGEVLCSPRMSAILLQHVAGLAARDPGPRSPSRLTPRELEILRLIDRDLSNKQIARQLQIEISTVKNHIHSILEKLQVPCRSEAAAWARTYGTGR
jgi:DNA-binding NarL/FixJ family response regulator